MNYEQFERSVTYQSTQPRRACVILLLLFLLLLILITSDVHINHPPTTHSHPPLHPPMLQLLQCRCSPASRTIRRRYIPVKVTVESSVPTPSLAEFSSLYPQPLPSISNVATNTLSPAATATASSTTSDFCVFFTGHSLTRCLNYICNASIYALEAWSSRQNRLITTGSEWRLWTVSFCRTTALDTGAEIWKLLGGVHGFVLANRRKKKKRERRR